MLHVIPRCGSSPGPDVPLALGQRLLFWEAALPARCLQGPVAGGSPQAPAGTGTHQS